MTQTQLKAALATQKSSQQKLGEILIQQGLVTPTQLRQALNEQGWRNLAATLLLSISTLLPSLPKVIAQVPEVPNYRPRHNQPLVSNEDIDGSEPKDSTGGFAESSSHNSLTQAPLAQQASVSSPLRGFCHPLNGEGWLSQGIRGKTHQGRMEFAYDLGASIGTPVYAMRAGKVIAVRDKYPDVGGGKENIARFNYVWIEHDGGYRSMYAHLQQGFRGKVAIKAGDLVKAGQLIGYSGNSGWSTGPHLHVEVQQPSERRTFTQTVPFAIAGTCQTGELASNPN
ncbi:MAG: peptidoglycan DD-metalloendopeptidase family protein [Acaryochloris sp. RU_4_1]|nr:peptidoglycan DD-metalloendopeptidase family protein [Leptolyngbyaceae cyanobacterium SU_3_3]NJM67400.1 peptidoglycan DD-metalloendopeptidase family protein [Acaryochloris sp. RU_4_1]NJR62303.1 peptidoglycan DD-metalloendopeptidase family protein [Cyanobacteria bacterium CRU_2_1]